MKKSIANILLLLFAVCLFFLSCANRQSPSGGPDDKTGPAVLSATPSSGSVQVPTDVKIIITFSEWLLPASEKGVTLFPVTPIKTKVIGKRLEIKPQKRLSDSTTYHLVITSTLKDLHNNAMTRPLSIVFSTGPALDSGTIDGCVADPQRKLFQPLVVLFRLPRPPDDSGYSGPPTYMAQSDSSGRFEFTHIRTGPYALFAYLDKNSDSRLQTDEDLYIPADSSVTVGPASATVRLYPASFDTTRQSIATIAAINNRTIAGQWKKPWDSLACPSVPSFTLKPADSSSAAIPLALNLENGSPRLILLPDTTLDSIPYLLIYTLKSIFDTAAVSDTLRLNGAPQADTSAPFLTGSSPKINADLQPEIRFYWSEPVAVTFPLIMADSLGDTLALSGDTTAADTTRITVPRSLIPGRQYRIILLSAHGKDYSGNNLRCRDSTDTASIISISTVRPDSLAVSLQGGAPCLESSRLRKWRFSPLVGGRSFTVADRGNAFRFDSLPAAKGKIETFIDRNGNDRPDAGRLLPFVAPEPFLMFEDTVEARARWDVEGVELGPCDPCYRRPAEENGDSSGIEEK
jgi:hypothetical protein